MPAGGHRVHGAGVERATAGGAGVLVRAGHQRPQATTLPADGHPVNGCDDGVCDLSRDTDRNLRTVRARPWRCCQLPTSILAMRPPSPLAQPALPVMSMAS